MADNEDEYDITDAAKEMGFTPQYVRQLIRKGTLLTVMKPIVPESLVKHHMVTRTEIDRYMGTTRRKTRREDGRNKFVMYMTLVELAKVKTVLKANDLKEVAETIRSWNPLKAVTARPKAPATKKVKRAKAV